MEEGRLEERIPRNPGFGSGSVVLVWGGRRSRARAIGQWGPAVSGTGASERGAGDRGEGAPGVRVAAGPAWRVDGPRESEREKVRWAFGPLASAIFYKAQTRKLNKGKTIILLYRHIIYQNDRKNKSYNMNIFTW